MTGNDRPPTLKMFEIGWKKIIINSHVFFYTAKIQIQPSLSLYIARFVKSPFLYILLETTNTPGF